MEAHSWLLTGHVVLQASDQQLAMATFVRYHRQLAAMVWPPISLIHREVALAIMRSAVRAQ